MFHRYTIVPSGSSYVEERDLALPRSGAVGAVEWALSGQRRYEDEHRLNLIRFLSKLGYFDSRSNHRSAGDLRDALCQLVKRGLLMVIKESLRQQPIAEPEACGVGRVTHHRSPDKLVTLMGINAPGSPKQVKLVPKAADAWRRLVTHARRDGFAEPLLLIVSGWRDDSKQSDLWKTALANAQGDVSEARKVVAPPGQSAHRTGLAADLWLGMPCRKANDAQLKKTEVFKWMVTNANGHGWNPYEFEAWHWEFNVGDD